MLSVLVSVKNEARYVESALRSIEPAVETLGVEVVVVDDGSTDGTADVIEALGLPYVNLVRTEGIGKAAAYSLAYERATGSYFVLFAGDDLLIPGVLEHRIAPLRGNEAPAVTFCKLKSFSEQQRYDGMELPKHPRQGLESGGCIAFNRAFGDTAFPIPPTLANEDSWLMLQVRFGSVRIEHVPQVGLLYRIHANNSYKRGVQFTQVNEQMWMRQRALFFFYEKYRERLTAVQQRQVLLEFALQLLRYLGRPALLMLLPGLTLKAKVKVLFNSRPSLYWIRERFYSFFSGR
ncbi:MULTISPECIES: glycosyltransferase family 2 protein [Pseudomonas]|uniref:Glycosyltransferase n=1 Tax=Pseudomonas mosselii TaxID=78327 RepID=A0A5R8Z6B7_9PSED|nr:glycosyltransferase [Pseudomonas mosselii]TLP61161.1 glycosyltransferase [Pseudomonas mosselii]